MGKEKHEKRETGEKRVNVFRAALMLVIIAAIAAPSALAIRYNGQLREKQETIEAQSQEISQLQVELLKAQEEAEPLGEAMPYQELYPDFYVTPPEKTYLPEQKTIYLTFDDGPSDRTDEVLEILERQNVKATFFVVGKSDEAAKQRMRAIVEGGHALAMHSYTHDYKKIYASVEAYLDDMYKIFCLIRDTTGEAPTMFRFPGGSINAYNYNIYQEIMAEMLRRGFIPYDWNASSGDAVQKAATAATITNNIVTGAKRTHRGIVLMHDSQPKRETVQGLESAIVQLKEAGYAFDKLSPEIQPVLFSYKE